MAKIGTGICVLGLFGVLALLMSCDQEGINSNPPDYGIRTDMTSALKDPEKVVVLILSNDTISVLPNELILFRNMTDLRVVDCPLKGISPVFGEVKSLQHANFSNCEISEIPEYVYSASGLIGLSLSGNHIVIIPDSISRLVNLEALYLNGNKISTVPPSIVNMNKLITLGLKNNMISALPDSLGRMVDLRFLYLNGNPIPAKERLRIQAALQKAYIEF